MGLAGRRNVLATSKPVIGQLRPVQFSDRLKLSTRSFLSGSELDSSQYFEYSTTETDCQKSLPNIVRSPFSSRMRNPNENFGLNQLGSKEHDSFILELDPVEENEEC